MKIAHVRKMLKLVKSERSFRKSLRNHAQQVRTKKFPMNLCFRYLLNRLSQVVAKIVVMSDRRSHPVK